MEKELQLKLESQTFENLRKNFDDLLQLVMIDLEKDGGDEAEISIKVKIDVSREEGKMIPLFSHNVTSSIQKKSKRTGIFKEEYFIEWDSDKKTYVLKVLDDGQETFY